MKVNLSILLLALAILLLPIVWHFSDEFIGAGDAPDTALKSDFDALAEQVAELREAAATQTAEIANLKARLEDIETRQNLAIADQIEPETRIVGPDENRVEDIYARVVLVGDRRAVNQGLSVPNTRFLTEFLGHPRIEEDYSDECQPMTNPALTELLETADVGPIRVRMLRPAIISLRQIFRNVQVYDRDLYDRINTAGSLCIRLVRGSEESISSHSFGLSVDINIDGQLDTLGDGKTQLGLTILSEFFNKEGWIWGAGFGREDSMHFEVSKEKLEQWRRLGQI